MEQRLIKWGAVYVLVASGAVFVMYRLMNHINPVAVLGLSLLYFIGCLLYLMLHMVVRLGPVNALLFCLLSTGISAGTELLGTKTGIIFGSYHYTEIMGPKIFGTLPALIG